MEFSFDCKLCGKIFDIPLVLPCKNCICESCANQLVYTNVISSNEIFQPVWKTECSLCREIHEKPENGFPVEDNLFQIIKAKNECIKILANFEIRQKNFEDRKNDMENIIKSNSEKMKSNLEDSIQNLLSRVNSKKCDILKRLGKLEARSNERFDEMKNKMIVEPIEKINEFNRLKDSNETPKRIIKHSVCQCKELLECINLEKIDFDNCVENYLSTTFKEANIKLGESFIGNIDKLEIA